ncbi:TVP38/TMEM64 family protein [Sinanaerobacter sp. ZZT-01]|uniref:TVP38/TMEM64 family protein n=1 Tax=Sinanaerobacter sp. ZZT-01 TaxID=3111540 RepID=UPI002D79C988|nr:TVP38/TMEM64 family protein [Sinanaerobacter sp. ZZT-01]WRR93116.1 TVP38/TMEM64 family protein [Sinanaerobacter sp. ZZT-01]
MQRDKRKRQFQIFFSIVKLTLLLVIALGIPFILYFWFPDILNRFHTQEELNAFLSEYHTFGMFLYIGLQILQIVICIIPGQMMQFAAGYVYYFWIGFFLSMIGIGLGTVITFYLARILGKNAMHVLFGEKKINHFIEMLNSKRAYMVIFILYLIPGFPKDLITYAAGVSEIKLKPYLVLSLVGRTPALMATIMIGAMTRTGSYMNVILLCIAVAFVTLICFIHRKKFIGFTDIIYHRLVQTKKRNY